MNPSRPNTLYAATSAGLYASHDGGDSWLMPTNDPLLAAEILAVVVAPSEPDRLYISTVQGQILTSADGGAHWRAPASSLPPQLFWSLAVHPQIPTLVYAGSDILYRSEDAGLHWIALPSPIIGARISAIALHQALGQTLYIATDKGIYRSADGGQTWSEANRGLPTDARVECLLITQWPAPGSQIVLCASAGKGIYRSLDGGASWQPAAQSLGAATVLAYSAAQPFILYGGFAGQGLGRSIDGGDHWELISPPLDASGVSALALDPGRPNLLYAGTGIGLYRSVNMGAGWGSIGSNIVGSDVYALQSLPGRAGYLVASTIWGIYRTEDGGQQWRIADGAAGIQALSLAVASSRLLYAGTWAGKLYRSDDGGISWSWLADIAPGSPVTALALDMGENVEQASQPALYAATAGAGVWQSADSGKSWKPLATGLKDRQVLSLALATDQGSGSTLLAGTPSGAFVLSLGAQSASWQPVTQLPPAEIRAWAAHESGSLWAATADALFKSRDAGRSWDRVGAASLNRLDANNIQALYAPAGNSRALYLGTAQGILASADRGQSWQPIMQGAWVYALCADAARPEQLYAAVRGSGVWTGQGISPFLFHWWAIGVVVVIGTVAAGVFYGLKRRTRPSLPAHKSAELRAKDEADQQVWAEARAQVLQALMRQGQATFDTLTGVPPKQRLAALRRYPTLFPDEDVLWKEKPPRVELAELRRTQAFLRNWQAAQSRLDNASAFRAAASRLADQLCSLLGFTRLSSRSYRSMVSFVVEGLTLRLRVPSRFPIVFMRKTQFTSEDIQDVRALMDILHMTSYFALLIVFGEASVSDPLPTTTQADTLRALAKETAHDLIVLDFQDVFSILIAKRRERQLTRLLLRQMDLTVVSPYVTFGPVPENMFFGRDQEIKVITRTIRDASFAVVGGRKIGKTSLLTHINRLLAQTPGLAPLYLDCQAVTDHAAFLAAVRSRWQLAVGQAAGLSAAPAEAFEQVLALLPRPDALPVILLDEVDGLLAFDKTQQHQLFGAFRALSQEKRCRFVFCGEQVLNRELQDAQSPLFNFCQALTLSFLTPESTRRVILEPLEEMGISFSESETLVEQIAELSSRHPNIVQYICQQLLVQLNARATRTIRPEDLQLISESRYFADYFLSVIWGSATPLEKLITLVMIEHPLCTLHELLTILNERLTQAGCQISEATLQQALDHLTLCSVLDRERQYYAFAAHSFPDIVENGQDVPTLMEQLSKQIAVSNEGKRDA